MIGSQPDLRSAAAPAVSVILPTRNRADLLRRSVQSVLAQTWTDLELIVVDDASTDHTAEVLGRFTDPRLRVLRRERNSGAAAARNAGMSAARGRYIAFQDDDDFWLLTKLEKQVEHLRRSSDDVGLCLCGLITLTVERAVYAGGEAYFKQLDFNQGGGWDGPHVSMISTPGWLVRRHWLDRAGPFDERLGCMDDWELALRLWKICRLTHVPEPLFIQDFRRIGTGMAFNELAQARDLEIITQKHGAMWHGKRRIQARHFYSIGKAYSLYRSPKDGLPWLLRSLREWPFQIRGWAALAVSLLGQGSVAWLTRTRRKLRRFLRRAKT